VDAVQELFKREARIMLAMMRWLLALLSLIIASPAMAQSPMPVWNPAAAYVTPGQDEPGYRRWVGASSWRPVYVKAFNNYLTTYGVGGVVPTWQLLRTASDWHKCGAQPYEVPPTSAWPNIVAALRYVGAYVIPRIGPVEAVSVYRNPALNACAHGAPTSTHLHMGGVDMVPLRPISREALMSELCAIHHASGSANATGLGFYKGLRFHIDARKYREWGTVGIKGGFGCASVLAEGAAPFQAVPAASPIAVTPASIDPLAPQR
jgi:hypothetical protein